MQIKNFLQKKPLHTFLIGLYIITFLYVRNMAEVTMSMTYRSLITNFVVSGLLFGVSYICLKSARKAGIFSTLLLVSFFTYGFIYSQLENLFYKGWWPFTHIHRFLLILYFVLYLLLFILLYRSKRPHYNLNYLLNLFIVSAFGLNIFFGLFNLDKIEDSHANNPFISSRTQSFHPASALKGLLPDVYYIILDGYAGEKTLQEFYAEENPSLYSFLRDNGFYVADSSRANYPFTVLSLASSLNIDYLDSAKENKGSNELIRQNLVSYVFRQANYKVVSIESGYAVTENLAFIDKTIPTYALNEFENRLLELTVLRLDDVLGVSNYLRLKSELKQLQLFVEESGPKFSFIHIVSPHPPYVLDSAGKRKMRISISDMAWEPRNDYLQQLQYVSKRIMEFINLILANSKTPPIIVLQSDHGPWIKDKNPAYVHEARTRILNAFYVPDSIKTHLYPAITPVNSFRIIFSELFNEKYPLLPDRPVPYAELKEDVTFKKYTQ